MQLVKAEPKPIRFQSQYSSQVPECLQREKNLLNRFTQQTYMSTHARLCSRCSLYSNEQNKQNPISY